MKFDDNYNNKKYIYEDNTIYIGPYVLKFLEVFRLYLMLPFIYLIGNLFFIWYGTNYYRFFEFFLFFILIILLLAAELSNFVNNLFAVDRKGHRVLAFNVCVNLVLIFIIYVFLVSYCMNLTSFYKFSPLVQNHYFGSSPVTDCARVTIGLLFIINIFFSFSHVYFNKRLSYEFYILLAFAYTFLLMCLVCRNLFLLLILIEGLSLSLVGCICYTKNKVAYEVSLKFFVLSALFAVLGIFGALMILISTHTLDYRNLSFVSCFSLIAHMDFLTAVDKIVLFAGVVLVISALLFKLGVFPFHAYIADFAAASAYPLLFFFLGPLKLGIFFILVLVYLMFFMFLEKLNTIFMFTGLASILIGAKGAFSENELKKFLGFTSINQIGFALIAMSVPGFPALASAFIFFYIYLITNILFLYVPMQCFDKNNNEAFLYLNHFAYYSKLDDKDFHEGFLIEDHKLLDGAENHTNPENRFEFLEHDRRNKFNYQTRFIVLMFSFIGIPPLPGFGGKYLIFYNLILNEHLILVFVVMIISLISAYYYLNLIYKLFSKNLTPSFIINYEFLKMYKNFFCTGFHTYLFWSFIILGILVLDPVLFCNFTIFLKNGF